MSTENLFPPLRLVASGGPVSRAVQAGRGEFDLDSERIRAYRAAAVQRIYAEAALLERIDAVLVARRVATGGAA